MDIAHPRQHAPSKPPAPSRTVVTLTVVAYTVAGVSADTAVTRAAGAAVRED